MVVLLRPLTPADFGMLFEWNRDEVFCRAAGWTPNLPRETVNAFWERLLAAPDVDFLRLGIEADGELVAYADLAEIDHTNSAAEFGIVVGPSRNWGRGIGRVAGLLMFQHGFNTLGLARIWAEVHAPNTRSLALMKKLGFRQEGVGSEQQMYDGQLAEMVQFNLSRDEFKSVQRPISIF